MDDVAAIRERITTRRDNWLAIAQQQARNGHYDKALDAQTRAEELTELLASVIGGR